MAQGVDHVVGLLHDLPQDEHDTDSQDPPQQPTREHRAGSHWLSGSNVFWLSAWKIVVGFLALWGLIDASKRAHQAASFVLSNPTPNCWCGTSDQEAIDMGCRYDHIAVDWLPMSCIDTKLTEEFDLSGPGKDGSWPYYDSLPHALSNTSSEKMLTTDQIDSFAAHGKGYFTTKEWHIQHCMFIWRKQFRSGFDSRRIEPWNNNEEHIQHCNDYIMQTIRWKLDLEVVDTEILGVNRHIDEQ